MDKLNPRLFQHRPDRKSNVLDFSFALDDPDHGREEDEIIAGGDDGHRIPGGQDLPQFQGSGEAGVASSYHEYLAH